MLAQSCLFYFKDPASVEPIGFIQMENVLIDFQRSKTAAHKGQGGKMGKLEIRPAKKGQVIKSVKYDPRTKTMVHGNHAVCHFRVKRDSELEEWVRVLRKKRVVHDKMGEQGERVRPQATSTQERGNRLVGALEITQPGG